jgi:CubicO group peptidase (beta-lactamase class C family)
MGRGSAASWRGALIIRYTAGLLLCFAFVMTSWFIVESSRAHPYLALFGAASLFLSITVGIIPRLHLRWDRQTQGAHPVNDNELEIADDCLPLINRVTRVASFAELIIVNGRDVRAVAYRKETVDRPDVSYEIGSLSKALTALLLACMVIERQVKLADSLGRYLTKLPNHVAEMTIIQLATHTSGLPRLPLDYRLLLRAHLAIPNPYGHFSKDRLMRSLKRVPPIPSGPRSVLYSNFGYAVLGLVLSTAAGEDFEDLMYRKIFEPLEMRHSSFCSRSAETFLVPGHDKFGLRVSPWCSPIFSPAGGVRMTANDMILMMQAFLEPRSSPLSPALELTLEPVVISKLLTTGLGWQIGVSSSRENIYWHNGSTSGCGVSMAIYPTRQRAAALLKNAHHEPEMDRLVLEIATS